MATCTTAQWSSGTTPQVRLTVTQKSETATTATLAWTLAYITHGYAANTNGVGRAYSVTINGAKVKSGTYNINGLGGSNTRTIASGTTTVNKGTAAKSISFSCSFAFSITWSGVYGGTKTASGSISVAKKTSYTVSFNANGGSGAPSAQTKWYGTTLALSSTKPTRSGYTFLGWATTSSATSAKYAAGGSYTANASATLYAVWRAAYWVPKVTNVKALRCDSSGTLDPNGKYAKVEFGYQVYSGLTVKSATVTCNGATTNATVSGGKGSAIVGAGALAVETSYTATIKVTDSSSNATNYKSVNVNVSTAKIPLHFKAGGTGVKIGGFAENDGFEVAMPTAFTMEDPSGFIESNVPFRTFVRCQTCSEDVSLSTGALVAKCGTLQYDTSRGSLTADSNGAIVCNRAGRVLVLAQAYFQGLTSGDTVACQVWKNGATTGGGRSVAGAKGTVSAAYPPRVMNVNAGDYFDMRVLNANAARGKVATGSATSLTVMYIL